MNRLAIYFFYDKDGIVDDYVPYFLNSLKSLCSEILIVVNGHVDDKGLQTLKNYAKTVLIRENNGLDVYAYRESIRHIGYENIKNFDELILCNFTFFGPIYSLKGMFDAMASKQYDIWGPYKDTIKKIKSEKNTIYHVLPSFFIVYRKSILNSHFFKEYWESRPMITSYADSVLFHEQKQSMFFEEKGFISGSFIDNTKYKTHWEQQWSTIFPSNMIIEDGYPFLKRRHFYIENGTIFNRVENYDIYDTIKYIQNKTDYNIDYIYNNITRTQNLAELGKCKPLTFKYYKRLIMSKLVPFPSIRKRYKEKVLHEFLNSNSNPRMLYHENFRKIFDKK